MMNNSNKQIDITADITHMLAVETNCTLKEINDIVKDSIYDIVWKVIRTREEQEERQSLLFKK